MTEPSPVTEPSTADDAPPPSPYGSPYGSPDDTHRPRATSPNPYTLSPSQASTSLGQASTSLESRRGRRRREKQEEQETPEEQDESPDVPAVPAAALPTTTAVLLVWALTSLVGDVGWGPLGILPVGLAALSPLLAVPALIITPMAMQRHSLISLMLAIAAAALPWALTVRYIIPASPPAGATLPLRVLLVAADNGRANATDITAAARLQGTDLIVVTELSPTLAHELTSTGLARAFSPRYVSVPEEGHSPSSGLGLYSRLPVDELHPVAGTRWPAVRARVMVGRTPVTVVAGHAVRPSVHDLDTWRRDLRALEAGARVEGPVLVLASLNATPWNPQFRRITSGRLHDAADVLGRGLRPTWPSWLGFPLLPTDHILVAGIGVSALGTITIGETDHRALSAELLVPRA